MSITEASQLRAARVGTVLSLMAFSFKPRILNLLQQCVGVDLWRQGTSQGVLRFLNYLGLSQGPDAARAHVDILCQEHDSYLRSLKSSIEVIKTSGLSKRTYTAINGSILKYPDFFSVSLFLE